MSVTNSHSGSASVSPSPSTKAATASASTAPVGSFSADSATTVCRTFARSPIRSKSGMRMAGSVGASTAPTRRPASKGRSNASAATDPVTTAVSTTPGTASRPSPTATGLSTLKASPSPP